MQNRIEFIPTVVTDIFHIGTWHQAKEKGEKTESTQNTIR